MGEVNTAFTQRKRYTFYYKDKQYRLKVDPIGWDSIDKGIEIARNEDASYHGVYSKFSNTLRFSKDSKDFLKSVYAVDSIMGKVKLLEEEKHPHTGLWEYSLEGDLDFTTYEILNNIVSIKFNSAGLEEVIKARNNDKFEIDREKDLLGNLTAPLIPKTVIDEGRKIFLKSDWKTDALQSTAYMSIESNTNSSRNSSCSIPLKVINRSHEEAQYVTELVTGDESNSSVAMEFFSNADRTKTFNLKFNLKFEVNHIDSFEASDRIFDVRLSKVALDGAIISTQFLEHNTGFQIRRGIYNLSYNQQITLLETESLSLYFFIKASFNVNFQSRFRIGIRNIECNVTLNEDSIFEQTTLNFILIHEIFKRLARIITSKEGTFYSEYFGSIADGYLKNGVGSNIGATHGFWVRQFDKLPLSTTEKINLFKPLTTSWNELVTSTHASLNVAFGIEKIGRQEKLVVEDMRYFYNRNIITKLPHQLNNVKRSPAVKYFNSSIEIGYDKGDVFEEAVGLDEPNKKSNFITYLTKGTSLTKISSIIASNYKREFARRKPQYKYQNLSHESDNNLFFLDLKKDNTGLFYKFRKWQDDFAQVPTGIYAPETATELRFSPINMLLRHSWFFGAGLLKFPSQYIRYGSSETNSNLKTKLRTDSIYLQDTSAFIGDGNEYSESGDILNSQLKRAVFKAE